MNTIRTQAGAVMAELIEKAGLKSGDLVVIGCSTSEVIGIDSPVTVVQMLWLNFIMDTLGGLAFAGEAAEERIMRERPKARGEEILSPYMRGRIGFLGLFSLMLSLVNAWVQ